MQLITQVQLPALARLHRNVPAHCVTLTTLSTATVASIRTHPLLQRATHFGHLDVVDSTERRPFQPADDPVAQYAGVPIQRRAAPP
jgi:hypothetical protein